MDLSTQLAELDWLAPPRVRQLERVGLVTVEDLLTFRLGWGILLTQETWPVLKAIADLGIVGFGMPDPQGGSRGDLMVHVHVEVPKKLTKKHEDLLRQLADLDQKHVSPHRKSFFEERVENAEMPVAARGGHGHHARRLRG